VGNWFWVGVGGCVGSVLRYYLSGLVHQWTGREDFPIGTLAVNLAGCLVIGALSQLAEARGVFSPEARAFVFIGILGGFTTFSSFANETVMLWRDGESLLAFANVAAQVVLGLGAVVLGGAMSRTIWG
jgi:fluoride exporter